MKNDNSLNRQVVIFIFCVFCFKSAYSQLFVGGKHLEFYVEITPDSAHVESYYSWRYRTVQTRSEEFLVKNPNASDTVYRGNNFHIIKMRDEFLLIDQSKKRTSKISLKSCSFEMRDQVRKDAYLGLKMDALYQLRDSLADSSLFRNLLDYRLLPHVSDSIDLDRYKREMDSAYSKLMEPIILSESARVHHYYKMAHSINEINTNELFTLLDSANYSFHYGQYLVYQLSQENPALLIQYLNQEPANSRSILRAIRNYEHAEQIHDSVKTVKEKSAGRRKILRQKAIHQAGMVGGITLYSVAFLAEITGIVLLFVWIF